MTSRANPFQSHFPLIQPLIDYSTAAQQGLDPALVELVKIRASQINGCARCLVMHAHDARKNGETEERLLLLDAWRESSFYTERERAALAWTEALTFVHETGAPDDVYDSLQAHFDEKELIQLTLLIGAINAFNRLNVGFHAPHGAARGRKAA